MRSLLPVLQLMPNAYIFETADRSQRFHSIMFRLGVLPPSYKHYPTALRFGQTMAHTFQCFIVMPVTYEMALVCF